jgi:AraC family transcriptional regulator
MTPLFEETQNALSSIKINDNSLVLSSLQAFYHTIQSQGFAIKYVVEGVERYTLNGIPFPIQTGSYLLSNNTSEGHIEIEQGRNVKGICINLLPELLSEVVGSLQRPDTAFSDHDLGRFFSSHLFLENQYDARYTQVGALLRVLTDDIRYRALQDKDLTMEFFYNIAERLVADQTPIFRQLHTIPSVKAATKKDLCRRLYRGREFMDAYFVNPLTVADTARAACMSEYHFFRLFKLAFGLSPNQYLIQRRLEYGRQLLQKQQCSVSAAAVEAGFSDIYTFSKAYKKYFGVGPSVEKARTGF